MSFDKDKIIIKYEDGSKFYKIRYREGGRNSKIMFQIDHARIPFGIDEEYEQYYITLEVRDVEYIEYIREIEGGLRDVLCEHLIDEGVLLDEIDIHTQIRKSKNGYFIKTKIPQYKNKFSVTCIDGGGFHKSILDVERGTWATFVLYIDYAWIKEERIHYKWKIHRLEIE